MSVQLYGDLPGVTATVRGGSIAQVNVGYEQLLVLFGRGDDSAGDASYDTPTQVNTAVDASTQFGDGTQLTHAVEKAFENGANPDYVFGVMPTETTVSAEPIDGGSGTLTNAPIVEDPAAITVTNTTDASSAGIVFRYESAPDTTDLDADQVAINPLTGEVASGGTDSYEVDYSYLEWEQALDAADTVVGHNEYGIYCTLTDAESVAQSLSAKLDELRPTYKLLRGLSGAQPNATNANGEPVVNIDGTPVDGGPEYTDTIDNEALFLAGPVRLSGVGDDQDGYGGQYGQSYGSDTGPFGWTVLGGLAGLFAGNPLTDPIYGDGISGYGSLIQQVTITQEGDPIEPDGSGGTGLRGEQVMPIRDSARDGAEGLTVEDNLSTSTATDYPRDYHRRRIIDQILIAAREIGETLRGRRGRDPIISDTEETIVDVLEDMATDGLLETNEESGTGQQTSEERLYGATISQTDTDTYAVEVAFRPVGLAKNIEETLVVDA